jgi:TonB family protein
MLPLEALNDLEKMRETLEIVITQSKEIGKTPAKTSEAMGLLEEAINSRTMLARDDYDARRWKDEVLDTREAMANSRSVVLSAVQGEPATVEAPKADLIASNNSPVVMQPVVETKPAETRQREVKTADNPVSENKQAVQQSAPPTQTAAGQAAAGEPAAKPESSASDASKTTGPLDVGSLKDFATAKPTPIYPQAAKLIRQSGIVRVDVTVNEAGEVTEVQKTTGPAMLQAAARDAIKKWKFKPFTRDGQPVKATGYVSFNFNL